jgi:hypothetical protein
VLRAQHALELALDLAALLKFILRIIHLNMAFMLFRESRADVHHRAGWITSRYAFY